jgi:hypothetical protein
VSLGQRYARVQFGAEGIGYLQIYCTFDVATSFFRIQVRDRTTGEDACSPLTRRLWTSFFLGP